jgi:acetyl-CoA acetyltransferase
MLIALSVSVSISPDAVHKDMGWDLAKVNGGAIALGHRSELWRAGFR